MIVAELEENILFLASDAPKQNRSLTHNANRHAFKPYQPAKSDLTG